MCRPKRRTGYDGLSSLGYDHDPITISGNQSRTDESLPMIHFVFSNLKTWLLGTHHGVSPRHLPAYLNEFSSASTGGSTR